MRTFIINCLTRHGRALRTILIGILLSGVGLYCLPAQAANPFTQLTSSSDPRQPSVSPSLSADGAKVAFSSSADLVLGGNVDHSAEVFVMNADGTGLIQLTNAMWLDADSPALSADGSKVAFSSEADLTGGNTDGSWELFIINADGSGLIQLTDDSNPSQISDSPSLSDDGGRIAFHSNADLTGGNPDGSYEIFAINDDGTGLVQLTSDTNPASRSQNASLSADGGKVAFESNANLTGGNAGGLWAAFVMTTDGAGVPVQLFSNPPWFSGGPSLPADGIRVAFVSNADITGSNADHSAEVFVMNIDGTGPVQLSNNTDLTKAGDPTLSADGSTVAFVTSGDLTGVFMINADGTGLVQLLSDPVNSASTTSLSADGGRVVFDSESDLVPGGNTDNSWEIFMANIALPPPPVSTGGTLAGTQLNADGSLTYIFQGTGKLGGIYELTLPAGATATPGTSIDVKIDDATGQPGQPKFEVKNLVLPVGGTKTITIPRPVGSAEEVLCVNDTSPKGVVEIGNICKPKAGKGTVRLVGELGDFDFTLTDKVLRHVSFTPTTISVSGLLHSSIYLDIDDAPVADAGADQAVDEGVIVSLDGSGSSDADGDALTFTWTMDVAPTGSTLATWTGSGSNPSLTPDLPGDYTVSLVVNDGVQDGAADTVAIHVTANLPPVAAATGYPLSGLAPLTVYFDASGSYDPELLPIASYSWDFGDGTAASALVDPGHEYATHGSYTAVVTVTDDFGNTDQAQVNVNVTTPNLPPTVAPTATPISGTAPLEVQFASHASGPEVDDELSYSWVLGDGTTSTEAAPLHTYATAGTYMATVTVSDGSNTTAATLTISVGSTLTIDVTEAKVDFGEHGKVKGKITTKARFTYAGTPAPSDTVKVVFDGITLLEAPFGAFKADDDHPGKYKYKQKKMHAKIDFTKGEIKVSRHKMLLDGIDNTNGIDVVISFGNTVGADHFVMAEDEDEDDDDHDHKKEMHHKKHHEEDQD